MILLAVQLAIRRCSQDFANGARRGDRQSRRRHQMAVRERLSHSLRCQQIRAKVKIGRTRWQARTQRRATPHRAGLRRAHVRGCAWREGETIAKWVQMYHNNTFHAGAAAVSQRTRGSPRPRPDPYRPPQTSAPPKRVCAQGSYWYAATHMGSTTIGRMLTRRRRSHRRLFRHRLLHPLQTPPPPTSSPPHLLFAAASGPEVPTAHFVCIRGGSAAESRCEPHSRVASLLYGNCHSRLANVIASTILSLVRLACRSCSRVCSSSRLVVASKPSRSARLPGEQGVGGQTVSGITGVDS